MQLAMNCLAIPFITIMSLIVSVQAGEISSLTFKLPERVLNNDDIRGYCASGKSWPHVVIIRKNECNFDIERQRRTAGQDTNKFYYTDFVIKDVTATCKYMCFIEQSRVTKTVNVTDAEILPTPLNVTAFEDMPVKLKCTVRTNMQSKYKLIWMKGDAFVTGYGYTIDSTGFIMNIQQQHHFLTIQKASPGAYTCMLISTRREVIDTKTQHVVTEGNSKVSESDLFKYLAQFFKWNSHC